MENTQIINNLASGPLFNVTSGPCTAIGGCFYSPDYPYDYNINEICKIKVTENGTLNVKSFFTEPIYDFLTVNNIQYSSTTGPDGINIYKNDIIEFWSDYSVVSQGFEICYETIFSGGGFHILGGDLVLDNITITHNQAYSYGGGFSIDGGNVKISNSLISNNEVGQDGSGISFTSGSFIASNLNIILNKVVGASSSSLICDSSCVEGEYGNCTLIEGTSQCYTNCICLKCPSGKSSISIAANSIDTCISCSAGTYSEEGASTCTSCPKGTYAFDNKSDTSGGLSKQVTVSATTCNVCPSGHFSSTIGSIVCQQCASGKSSFANASSCTDCVPGKYSDSGVSSCTDCELGHAVSLGGAQRCVPCAVGKYASNTSSLTCQECNVGTSQSATGQSHCEECHAGTYSIVRGSASCLDCEGNYNSETGSTNCSLCVEHYFMDNHGECIECIDGASCPGGSSNPFPDAGYWVDRSKFSYGDRVYECPWNTCIGFQKVVNAHDNDDAMVNTLYACWSESTFDNKACDSSELMCAVGSTGPLCSTCEAHYTFVAADRTCLDCKSSEVALPSLALLIFGMTCLMIGSLIAGYIYMGDHYKIRKQINR